MITSDLRRIRKRARRIARPRLWHLLHWATFHALRDGEVNGRILFDTRTMSQAHTAIARKLAELADRGAFLYFGIRNAEDLGSLPIELRQVTDDGGVALEVEPVADVIMDGGRRGRGWRPAHTLTIDDLAR